ncbi:DNA topoisomerase 2-alpha [Heteronotia binoei]|uniref:DNA topoisomerase 2-alpha n=1 Tax=Heteronotia binoei TaxID=13085 RepID=UPI002930DCC2|nr:DNA topoisomerase 2-alpha [Heteronotia binoei]
MDLDVSLSPLKPVDGNYKGDKIKNKDAKRLSVERIYQKKTQLEHILLRPDTYIGSVEQVTQQMWVFDEDVGLNFRDVTFVPGLYKIFDEILVNAADNKQRDKSMSCIKVTIDPENNVISVWNNGKGIPVIEHKVEKVYVPALIFGQLLTSSNYDDDEKKVTGGRNGYGAKLCNIFSTRFTVETACREYQKLFKQTWTDNMSKAGQMTLKFFDDEDFTCITFKPDLTKFKMTVLDKDIVALMARRAYDVAGAVKDVKVFLNGKRLPVKGFRSYVDMYIKDKVDETGNPLKIIYEEVNSRWEVCLTMSERGFQQVSFVNSIATTKGGRHVDYVADQVVNKLLEVVKKKNKAGVGVKPFQVKSHIWVFINALIENPTFDSQTKENMTLQPKSFGSTCKLSEKFIKGVVGCGIVESILNWVSFKAQTQLNKKCSSVKHTRIKGIPKLDDANDAGSKNSISCTLILTEGDSAKTLAVSGLGIVGRDKYGVFPLRGKMLNVREASHKQIMENAEINSLIKIVGLQYKKNYDDPESLKSLRYGKIMIMTDQDQDGSHIKGLLINFIHHNWPSLLRHSFLEEFITPIVKASKNKEEIAFYSIPEFEEWKTNAPNYKSWKIKYYKGLGTSTSKEAKEYFAEMARHRIPFKYSGPEDDDAISLAFSKKKVEDRKEWLTNFMEDRRQRKLQGLPEEYLYGKATSCLTYNSFINKELILFSNMDNERSIPSLVDGLKPGQRKVIFTCFKRNDKREVKVAQLAGSVAEMSAYHHGEASLMMTIINLAQNFVGSNNLNLLQPIGQFGTRLHGGKDSASPRYIFTMLSPLARLMFPPVDDNVLTFLYDDNRRVEPEWYIPILPMVLINGAEGIGTGWSCKVPNFDVREVVNNLRRMLDGEEPLPMHPSYKNFKGTIVELGEKQYLVNGEISVLDSTTIEISELPVRTWTQVYKEQVLEPMLGGTEKTPPLLTDYKEYHTDTTVKFIVKMSEQKLAEAEAAGLHKVFKLQTPLSCTNMVLFDHAGCLKKYDTAEDILREFYELRLRFYGLRKDWLIGLLGAESAKLSNQARFILEKIDGKIVIENKPKKELIKVLIARGYESDPLKSWKESQQKDTYEEKEDDEESGKENESTADTGPDFNYLLNMPLWYLTKEKKDELCKQRDCKEVELQNLKRKAPDDLWKEDLAAFIETLEALEAKEKEDEMLEAAGRPIKGKAGKLKVKKQHLAEVMPSPHGRRVIPRVTEEMKMDATKKLKRKIKTEKTELFGDQGESPESEKEPTALKQRLGKKLKVEADTKKQSLLPFKPIKKKKRNPWSDSETEEDNVDSDPEAQAETDEDAVSKENVKIPASKLKVASKKATEKQMKKDQTQLPKVNSSTSTKILDSDDKPGTSASSLPPIGPRGKLAPRKRGPAKKARTTYEDNQPTIVDAFTKEKAAGKPRKAGAVVSSESEGDKAASKKPAVAKTKTTKRKPAFSSSEDSDADLEFVKKSTAIKKSKAEDESFRIDLGSDDDLSAAPAHGQRPGRSRKPVQYLEESEDEI